MQHSIKQIEQIAKKHYPSLPYHNFQHALQIRRNALKFVRRCKKYKIPVNREVVEIAALFHDAGYDKVKTNKEEYSSKIAEKELKKLKYPTKFINQVRNSIMATKSSWPLRARATEQKILRAADLLSFNSSYDNFLKAAKRIQNEYKILYNKDNFPFRKWTELVESYLKEEIKLTPQYKKDDFHRKARKNITRFLKENLKLRDK